MTMGATSKHLSPSELAAEYWRQDAICRKDQWVEAVRGEGYDEQELKASKRLYHELNTLYRFVMLPHALEG